MFSMSREPSAITTSLPRGCPPRNQVMLGEGSPVAVHWRDSEALLPAASRAKTTTSWGSWVNVGGVPVTVQEGDIVSWAMTHHDLHFAISSDFKVTGYSCARRAKCIGKCILNPLTTEFFPPRQHIFMHSAHTTFVGTPLPQHSLLSGHTWWGPHTWRDPSGNTVNDIHDPAIGGQKWMSAGFSPSISLNLDQNLILHHQFVFLRPWVGSMNIIRTKKKILGSMNLIKIKKTPMTGSPPACMFSGRCAPKSDQIFEFVPQSRP